MVKLLTKFGQVLKLVGNSFLSTVLYRFTRLDAGFFWELMMGDGELGIFYTKIESIVAYYF